MSIELDDGNASASAPAIEATRSIFPKGDTQMLDVGGNLRPTAEVQH